MKNIITTDKKKFLQEERTWFPSMTNNEYKEQMYNDVLFCENCGILYWSDCVKRCDCK